MILTLNAVSEDKPGEKWKKLFEKFWDSYKIWFLSEGYSARPGYTTSSMKLRNFMPEIFPIYENLVELAGGGDVEARFLSQYCPPPYLTGCSQIVWGKNDQPALIRNYDFSSSFYEGILLYTNWLRPVIAMSDSIWGVLDGINDAGLSVSLSFGGRKIVGEGFGITLLLRYILETCETTESANEALQRIPVHMPYNVTVLDDKQNFSTAFLSPDRETIFTNSPICTNHQSKIEWEDYAKFTSTVERKNYLEGLLEKQSLTEKAIIKKFLKPPLYNTNFEKAFGTLYTSVYHPKEKSVEIHWPEKFIRQSIDSFKEETTTVRIGKVSKSKLSL